MSKDLILAKLDHCEVLLLQCRSVGDAKKIADIAEAARVYAKRVNAGIGVTNKAMEYRLRAERRMGELFQEGTKNHGANGKKFTGTKMVPLKDTTPTTPCTWLAN